MTWGQLNHPIAGARAQDSRVVYLAAGFAGMAGLLAGAQAGPLLAPQDVTASYELWSLNEDRQPLEIVAENAKVGFCLMDNLPIDENTAPAEPVYTDCDAEVQGISVGYGDIYVAALYEQKLNVSHVPDGRYRLINIANLGDLVRELDHGNNAAFVDVLISGESVALAEP